MSFYDYSTLLGLVATPIPVQDRTTTYLTIY